MQPILVIDHLRKRHPDGEQSLLFEGITTKVHRGDRIALLGASGQGKSTLIRVLARLEPVDEGTLSLFGQAASEWGPARWRQKVCYVPQLPVMFQETVEDNLRAASRLHHGAFDETLAQSLMKQAGLDDVDWSKRAMDLSGGQKQRVQLIRAMLLGPDILLLDEVTASLDTQSKHAVERMLKEWNEQKGTAMIWVTHDLEQARRVCNRIWLLQDRTLSQDSDTEAYWHGVSNGIGEL